MISMFKDFVKNKKTTKPIQLKLPEEFTEAAKNYKSKTAEEQKEWEDNAIKDLKEQSFYKNNPVLSNMSDEQLRNMIKMTYNFVGTGDDSND
ncbi:hypothetical protein AB4M78_08775 [Staphylococcus pasteuri]|uniref:DUF7366 family protein n=1 Tax=Staphylococcus pasteuri TaxID=45972 RepID=UPI0034C5E196